jgi:DNA-directed RNA polymerase subunit RPC12/RpoP
VGELFAVRCPDCGYQAEISGGVDAGDLVITRTMVCLNCKQVVDVVVGESHPGSAGSDTDFGRCPRCRGRKVVPWRKDRPCPKCGKRMTKGRSVCLWD